MSGEMVWQLWDCGDCGARGISCEHNFCHQCGHRRTFEEFDARYMPDEGAPQVSAADAARLERAGISWFCTICRADNAGDLMRCHHCQAPRGANEQWLRENPTWRAFVVSQDAREGDDGATAMLVEQLGEYAGQRAAAGLSFDPSIPHHQQLARAVADRDPHAQNTSPSRPAWEDSTLPSAALREPSEPITPGRIAMRCAGHLLGLLIFIFFIVPWFAEDITLTLSRRYLQIGTVLLTLSSLTAILWHIKNAPKIAPLHDDPIGNPLTSSLINQPFKFDLFTKIWLTSTAALTLIMWWSDLSGLSITALCLLSSLLFHILRTHLPSKLFKNYEIAPIFTILRAALGVAGGVFFFGSQIARDVPGEITKTTWTHTESIERWGPYAGEAWRDQIQVGDMRPPERGRGELPGGKIESCSKKYFGEERYRCGTKQVCRQVSGLLTLDGDSPFAGQTSCRWVDQGNGSAKRVCGAGPSPSSPPRPSSSWPSSKPSSSSPWPPSSASPSRPPSALTRTICEDVDTFCSRPVQKDWCHYSAHRWTAAQTETLSGEQGSEPRWPELPVGPLERRVQRPRYEAHILLDDGSRLTETADQLATWRRWRVGQRVTVHVSAGGERRLLFENPPAP